MYLDTDIILALVKQEDWLKEHVTLSQLQPAFTSVFTIIEARLVMEREYGRKEALRVLDEVRNLTITLLPLDEQVIQKSQELLQHYPFLNIFDSVQVAFSLLRNDTLISTDTLFSRIPGLQQKDPRAI